MEFPRIRPDVVKLELRSMSGEAIESRVKRPGGFARFLSGVGRFFGAVLAPLSVVFPPAIFGALGAYSASRVGDIMQRKAYEKAASQQTRDTGPMILPGLEQSAHDLTKDTAMVKSVSQQDQRMMDLLYARNEMMIDTAQKIKVG